jgi:hypothetical protein
MSHLSKRGQAHQSRSNGRWPSSQSQTLQDDEALNGSDEEKEVDVEEDNDVDGAAVQDGMDFWMLFGYLSRATQSEEERLTGRHGKSGRTDGRNDLKLRVEAVNLPKVDAFSALERAIPGVVVEHIEEVW